MEDYFDALSWVGGLMAGTPGDRLDHPTPCTEFTVRSLMGHLLGTAHRGLGTAQGVSTRTIPHVITDVADANLASAYRQLSAAIREAWIPLRADEEVTAPWGSCTVLAAARGFTVETVTHGWDLAVATGQPAEAPPGIAERCLSYAESVIPVRLRGVMYEAPAAGAGHASATERLANLLGHDRR